MELAHEMAVRVAYVSRHRYTRPDRLTYCSAAVCAAPFDERTPDACDARASSAKISHVQRPSPFGITFATKGPTMTVKPLPS